MLIGVEPMSDAYPEFVVLSAREWDEVGNQERFGDYKPDLDTALRYEAAGGLFLVTIRNERTLELDGYILFTISPNLRQRGRLIAQESAIYLKPERRAGRAWMMAKVMKYLEKVFAVLGAHTMEVGHYPDHNGERAGKFYTRLGYRKAAVAYDKVLEKPE